jgi:hypothetical protein
LFYDLGEITAVTLLLRFTRVEDEPAFDGMGATN